MKRLSVLGLILLAAGCGKGDNSCRDTRGGFVPSFYRVFFKTRDFGGGPITIEFKNVNGGSGSVTQKLSTTNTSGVTCTTTAGVVKASFEIGEDYTYHAYDNSRVWNGTIPSSCTGGSCETIELK